MATTYSDIQPIPAELDPFRKALELANMTYEKWVKLSDSERARLRDDSGLSPQLVGWEGYRVEVEDLDGEVRRFQVGISSGWRRIHLEMPRVDSSGGIPAATHYRRVKRMIRTDGGRGYMFWGLER
jgi:hypothetical protein